jgi:hypothetical protein
VQTAKQPSASPTLRVTLFSEKEHN